MERTGALLRVSSGGGSAGSGCVYGYADLMCWPELGDLAVGEELRRIAAGAPTRVGERALAMARLDAEARAAGRSLWEGVSDPPPSHWLLGTLTELEAAVSRGELERLREMGFRRLKVKWVGARESKLGIAVIQSASEKLASLGMKLRLDFNESAPWDGWSGWIDAWASDPAGWGEVFDYWEDPAPAARIDDWIRLREGCLGLSLFVDRAVEDPVLRDLADGWVIKPAWQDPMELTAPEKSRPMKRRVFTHALGHGLGGAFAAWYAAGECGTREACGLLPGNEGFVPTSAGLDVSALRGRPGIGWDEATLDGDWSRLA